MKIIYFDFAAIALMAVLIISGFASKLHKGKANRNFLYVMLCILFATVADTIAVYCDNIGTAPYPLQFWGHWFYMFFHFFTVVVYAIYLASRVGWRYDNIKGITWAWQSLPALVVIASLIVTIFKPFVFSVENGTYTRGNGLYVLYAATVYYSIVGIVVILRKHRILSRYEIVSIMLVFVFNLFSVVLGFLKPLLILELFSNAIAIAFVYNSVHKPSEFIYDETDCYNRHAFINDCVAAEQTKRSIGLIFLKVSDFDDLVLKLGYEGRKKLINEIAAQINKTVKKMQLFAGIYYLDDGQFYILLEKKKQFAKATALAEKINEAFNEPIIVDETNIKFNVSICVSFCPDDAADFNEIASFGTRFGDKLPLNTVVKLSELKARGKEYDIMLKIDEIVDRAVKNDAFMVYYQPIWSIKEQRFVSAEALLRLNDPEYGFINPEVMIKSAERTGQIYYIGEFVLKTVCAFLASPEGMATGLDHINVNLSIIQCMENSFPLKVLRIVDSYGVPHSKVNLEITETMLAGNKYDMVAENIRVLTEMGFDFSIDDFGSGYSNLSRVLDFNAAVTKLDRTVVSQKNIDAHYEQLSHIVWMIKSQGATIVAEGVETHEQVSAIEKLGCDYIQGYYYARPMKTEDFVNLLCPKAQA